MYARYGRKDQAKALAFLALSALVSACSGAPDGGPAGSSDPAAPSGAAGASDAPVASPTPVASLKTKNGTTIEFYDFGSNALVMESGAAYTNPVLDKSKVLANRLVETWTDNAQGVPAPSVLRDLESRLSSQSGQGQRTFPAVNGAGPVQGGIPIAPEPTGVDDPGLQAAPSGCSNGCCDYQWLSTFSQCQNPRGYNWFLYNYGYTYSNSGNDIQSYVGMVCSAQGTSTWHVGIGGAGGTWSVLEANWKSYAWDASCPLWICLDAPATTSVNTPTNMHLHTYCGGWNQG